MGCGICILGRSISKVFAVFIFLGWWSANLDWGLVDLCGIKTCPSCLAVRMGLAPHVGEWADPKPENCLCIYLFSCARPRCGTQDLGLYLVGSSMQGMGSVVEWREPQSAGSVIAACKA